MIGGDSVQEGPIFMFGNGRNFQALVASMEKLERMMPEIKVIYGCHHEMENPPSRIVDVKKGAMMMLKGQVTGVFWVEMA